jgi:hypothetical protein
MGKHTKPYICTETSCSRPNFSDKAGLRRHESEKHRKHGAVRYYCQLESCPRNREGFARKRNRDSHVKTCRKTSSRQGVIDYSPIGDVEDFSKYPESSVGEVEMNDDQVVSGRNGGVGEMDSLRSKLQELETRKRELAVSQARVEEDVQAKLREKRELTVSQARVEEDIQAVKRTMQLL